MRGERVLLSTWLLLGACKTADHVDGETSSSTAGESTTTGESTSESGTDTGPSPCTADSCGESAWCDWGPDSCGAEGDGMCVPRPESCDGEPLDPVCGCDHQTYDSACEAYLAGVDVSGATTSCPAPDGMFPCGPQWCSVATQYCQHWLSDVADEPDTYFCVPIPDGCDISDCACFGDGELCITCVIVNGGLVLKCEP